MKGDSATTSTPACELRSSNGVCHCRECGTFFEADVADRESSGEPRCPQCFLSSWEPAGDIDENAVVIRTTTPFR